MNRFDWLSGYLARLQDEYMLVRHSNAQCLAPAHALELDPEDWGSAARMAVSIGCRWAGV